MLDWIGSSVYFSIKTLKWCNHMAENSFIWTHVHFKMAQLANTGITITITAKN